ncbi:MAG: biotin/lipoyl-containing protein [Anaerolineae bacterium]|nr:biotin/lipoyl-containing protein [Anaerolineae bacterium]
MKYITTIGDQQFTIDINRDGQVTVDGEVVNIDMRQMDDTTMYSILMEGQSHDIRMSVGDSVYRAELSGEIFEVVVEDERTRRLAGLKGNADAMTGEAVIKAPMPGVVVEVLVRQGQRVEKGQIVIILESMKMQNEFKAPRTGEIHAVRVRAGDKVEQNAVMVTIT